MSGRVPLALSPSSSASLSASSVLNGNNNSTQTPALCVSPGLGVRVRVSRSGGGGGFPSSPALGTRNPSRPAGICKASQSVDLFPSICPEVVVRDARLEDCWEVADTHCSSFFPDYTFPVDLVLRIDRFVALLSGFSVPPGCMRTCLVAVMGTSVNDNIYVGCDDFKVGGFEGRFSFNKGSVAGILTVDTVADFLPRKGPLRQRRSNVQRLFSQKKQKKQRGGLGAVGFISGPDLIWQLRWDFESRTWSCSDLYGRQLWHLKCPRLERRNSPLAFIFICYIFFWL